MHNRFKIKEANMINCPICKKQAQLAYTSLLGYQEGSSYDIYFCKNCDASHARPLEIDENLYNVIYSKAKELPGYDRYHRFAEDVLKVNNPLLFLAETEDTYWAVYNYLSEQKLYPNPKILEVGCGLGYLTYAMVKGGYNAHGVDISKKAVNEAIKRYGNHYSCVDIYELKVEQSQKFDIIILTEVIEHVPDPVAFIGTLKELISDSGRILITTPNKHSLITKEKYWDTELPPVHLWWLSNTSFLSIAEVLSMSVSFTNFSQFQHKIKQSRIYSDPWRKQTLSTDGGLLFIVPHHKLRYNFRRVLIDYGLLGTWQSTKAIFTNSEKRGDISVSDRLCAIFSKDNE